MRASRFVAVILGFVVTGLAALLAGQSEAPQFEGKDTLLRPSGYREWVS